MAKSTRKTWTKTMAMARLRDIEAPLLDIQKLADNGGKMPYALRKKLQTAVTKVADVTQALKEWKP
jgi:hypothetical protein